MHSRNYSVKTGAIYGTHQLNQLYSTTRVRHQPQTIRGYAVLVFEKKITVNLNLFLKIFLRKIKKKKIKIISIYPRHNSKTATRTLRAQPNQNLEYFPPDSRTLRERLVLGGLSPRPRHHRRYSISIAQHFLPAINLSCMLAGTDGNCKFTHSVPMMVAKYTRA